MILIIRAFLVLALILSPVFSHAQELKATHGDWYLLKGEVDHAPVCYILSTPKESKGNFKFRGDAYLIISNSDDHADEVNASPGYFYKKESVATLEFPASASKKIEPFKLFTKDKNAWAKTPEEDFKIVNEMKERGFLYMKGTSSKGTISSDKYSLKGFSAAYDEMKKTCGAKE